MRHLALCIVLIALAAPVLAAPGGQGKGNGNAVGPAGDPPNGNSGQGHDAPAPPPKPPPPAPAPPPPAPGPAVLSPEGGLEAQDDQNLALDARTSGAALPLVRITALATAGHGGRVIDAKLIKTGRGLVYCITLLSDRGVSSKVFYDARTGAPTRAP